MSKFYSVTQSASGTSDWITFDHFPTSGKYTMIVTISDTATVDVEVTIDDPSGTPTTIRHPILQDLTTSLGSSFPMPLRGARLNVTSYTSGDITLSVLEGDR